MNHRYPTRRPLRSRSRPVTEALLLFLLCAGLAASETTRTLSFLDLTADVPVSWRTESPGSRMRVAELAIPGSEPGRLIVYFFGRGQGGTPEANIARWRGQFSNPDGRPVEPHLTRFQAAGIPITLARFEGSYARGIGAGSGAPRRVDQILLAAVLERESGNVIIQLFGPSATVREHEAAFGRFLHSLR